MKFIKTLLVAFWFLTGCNTPYTSSGDDLLSKVDTSQTFPQSISQTSNSIGELISSVDIQLKATKEDLEIFEDGIVPWISIAYPNKDFIRLFDADKVVVPYSKATLIIDYPLSKAAKFEISSKGSGFTRMELIQMISAKYYEIYKEEEASATAKTIPLEQRKNLINRNETNGKYGICCHDIGDLDLSSIKVYKSQAGEISLVLMVES